MSAKDNPKPVDGGLNPSLEPCASISDIEHKVCTALRRFTMEPTQDPVAINGMVEAFSMYVESGLVTPKVIINTLEEIFCERNVMITLACYHLLQRIEGIVIKQRFGVLK